jgi:hypothetical protein
MASQSVSVSSPIWDSRPDISSRLKVTALSMGAPSLMRRRICRLSELQSAVLVNCQYVQLFTIYLLPNVCIYNIYKAQTAHSRSRSRCRSLLLATSHHGHSLYRAPLGPMTICLFTFKIFVFYFLLRWTSFLTKGEVDPF